jgi:hypothetical protein
MAAARVPVTLMVFDILWLDRPLTGMTYRGRREVLEALALGGDRVVVPPAWPGHAAEEALAFTRDQGLEGLIAKRLSSTYTAGAHVHATGSKSSTCGRWTSSPDGYRPATPSKPCSWACPTTVVCGTSARWAPDSPTPSAKPWPRSWNASLHPPRR